MAIRRFREHVADHHWFAVLIDVGIVLLGVFLLDQIVPGHSPFQRFT